MVLYDNPLDGENMHDGIIEAGDDSKEAKKQKEADANMIQKQNQLASQEEVDTRETKHKHKEGKKEKKKTELREGSQGMKGLG